MSVLSKLKAAAWFPFKLAAGLVVGTVAVGVAVGAAVIGVAAIATAAALPVAGFAADLYLTAHSGIVGYPAACLAATVATKKPIFLTAAGAYLGYHLAKGASKFIESGFKTAGKLIDNIFESEPEKETQHDNSPTKTAKKTAKPEHQASAQQHQTRTPQQQANATPPQARTPQQQASAQQPQARAPQQQASAQQPQARTQSEKPLSHPNPNREKTAEYALASGRIHINNSDNKSTMRVTQWPSKDKGQVEFAREAAKKFLDGDKSACNIQITINPNKPEEAAYLAAALKEQNPQATLSCTNQDASILRAFQDSLIKATKQLSESKQDNANVPLAAPPTHETQAQRAASLS